jgi:hypothetical protein
MNKTAIANWLMPNEKLEDYLEEDTCVGHQMLVITSERAILLGISLFKNMQEKSDKSWTQFVGVHLKEYSFSAKMTLKFSRPGHQGRIVLDEPWILADLPKHKAHQVHLLLKEKELLARHERTENFQTLSKQK